MESKVNMVVQAQAGSSSRQSSASVVRNSIVANFATLFSIFTSFFLTPILLHALGTTNFAIWSVITTLIAQFAMIQFGLNISLPRQVATELSFGRKDKLDELFSTAFFTFVACGLVTMVLTMLIVAFPYWFMAATAAPLSVVRTTVIILGLNQALGFIIVLRDALNFGTGRMFVTSSLNVVVNTLMTFGFIIVAKLGFGVRGMAIIMLTSTVINIFLYRKLLSDEFSKMRPSKNKFNFNLLKDLLRVGRDAFFISLSGMLGSGANIIIISSLLSPVHVAYYAVSQRLLGFVTTLSTRFSSTALPTYAQAYAQGDTKRMSRIFTESVSVAFGIIGPSVLVSLALGNRIFTAWIGPGYEESALLWTLGLSGFWCRIPGDVAITLLNSTGKTNKITLIYLISAVINCALSYVLTMHFGAKGVFIATIIVAGVIDFLWLPAFACKNFGFSLLDFWKDTLLPLIPALFVAVCIAFIVHSSALPAGTFWTFAGIGAILIPTWTIWFCIGLPSSRREKFQMVVKRAFART